MKLSQSSRSSWAMVPRSWQLPSLRNSSLVNLGSCAAPEAGAGTGAEAEVGTSGADMKRSDGERSRGAVAAQRKSERRVAAPRGTEYSWAGRWTIGGHG